MESIHITLAISSLGNDTIETGTQPFNAETLCLNLQSKQCEFKLSQIK